MPSTEDPSFSSPRSRPGRVATESAPKVRPASTAGPSVPAASSKDAVTAAAATASTAAGSATAAPSSATRVSPDADNAALQLDDSTHDAPNARASEHPLVLKPWLDSGAASPARVHRRRRTWKKYGPLVVSLGAVVLFHAYLAAGIVLTWDKAPDFCHDVKLLTVITLLTYFFLMWYGAAALLDRYVSARDVGRSIRDSLAAAEEKRRWL
ncbi:uncharacterized protein LOC144124397 [Amblyomma americanum]